MTTYRLNGKKITRSEFLRTFYGMTRWIEEQVNEAIENGNKAPMFNTNLGPLVVVVK